MGDYHDHYLKKDVLLLADVFEKWYVLKILWAWSFSLLQFSGLSWNAMLKMTGVKLEKISDIDTYFFIEKKIRRGISYIAKRYAKANNKYINDYDSKNLPWHEQFVWLGTEWVSSL